MRVLLILGTLLMVFACDQGTDGGVSPGDGAVIPPYDGPGVVDPHPYADELIVFSPGPEAGTGQVGMPEVVLGPPAGKGPGSGSTDDVVSLGHGGEIVLGFSGRQILDGPGPDFIVFENAFWVGMDPGEPWAELGEVSVSDDGVSWHTYGCDTREMEPGQWPGCAGWSPTLEYEPDQVIPLWPPLVGGDLFDLEELGLTSARYVRIRDVSNEGLSPSGGFDLDAVGVVHISD